MTRELEFCQEYVVNNYSIKEAKNSIPDEKALTVLSRTYRAFGDPNRLKIMLALSQLELCVCELGEVLEMSAPAVSHHLRLLKDLGLVKTRRAGKLVYYALDDDHVQILLQTGLAHVEHRFNL